MVIADEKLYDVVFVVEATVINSEHFEQLKQAYILPLIKFFNGNVQPMETDWFGVEGAATQFCLLTFNNNKKLGLNVSCGAVTRNAFEFCLQLNRVKLDSGGITDCSLLGEGLAAALQTFDDMAKKRDNTSNVMKHCIVVGNTAPCNLPVIRNGPYHGYAFDVLLETLNKKAINLSIICARSVTQFKDILRKVAPADSSAILAKSTQYAVHPNHMVLLRGIQLSVQDIVNINQSATNKTNDGAMTRKATETDPLNGYPKKIKLEDTAQPLNPLKVPLPYQQPIVGMVRPQQIAIPPRIHTNVNPGQVLQPGNMQFNNASQVLSEMANKHLNNMAPVSNTPSMVTQQPTKRIPQQVPPAQPLPQQQERKLAWTGQLQWQETTLSGNEHSKSISRILPCHATISNTETLKTDVWPSTLHMNLIPQTYLQTLAQFLKTAKHVTFHFAQTDNDILQAMYRVMNGGGLANNVGSGNGQKFAGCVILNPPNPPNPAHVRVLLLIFSPRKKAFIGVIPDDQQQFVSELGAIISEDKKSTVKQQQTFSPNQIRPPRAVAPVMNPHISSTNPQMANAQMNTNQLTSSQINPIQMPTSLINANPMGVSQMNVGQRAVTQINQMSVPQMNTMAGAQFSNMANQMANSQMATNQMANSQMATNQMAASQMNANQMANSQMVSNQMTTSQMTTPQRNTNQMVAGQMNTNQITAPQMNTNQLFLVRKQQQQQQHNQSLRKLLQQQTQQLQQQNQQQAVNSQMLSQSWEQQQIRQQLMMQQQQQNQQRQQAAMVLAQQKQQQQQQQQQGQQLNDVYDFL